MFGLSPFELVVVGVVAILLFGSNLPQVARSVGKQYRDLRRGLNDIQDQFRQAEREVTKAFDAPAKSINDTFNEIDQELNREPSVPKFTPPPAEERSVAGTGESDVKA